MAEENAASHDVHESEFGLDRTEALGGYLAVAVLINNIHAEDVVRIALETFVAIGRDLVLPVCLRDWRADIVGVKTAVGHEVVVTDMGAILDVHRCERIPSHWSRNRGVSSGVCCPVDWLSGVLKQPNIVLILVRVQRDLLLLRSPRIHVLMGVEVSALSIVVTETDTRAESNVCRDICHSLGVQGGLELRGHEAIAIARVDKTKKVDGEESHVEGQWNNDQAKDASEEVFEPDSWGAVAGVAEKDPELEDGKRSNPCDGEESDPLDADSRTKTETSSRQPEPP